MNQVRPSVMSSLGVIADVQLSLACTLCLFAFPPSTATQRNLFLGST